MGLSKSEKKRLNVMAKAGRPRWGSGFHCRRVPSKRRDPQVRADTRELLLCAEEA